MAKKQKPAGKTQIKIVGVRRLPRAALLLGTALSGTAVMVLSQSAAAQPAANARPQGGVVAAGAATISQTASNTAITQSSQRAAVNWNSFNVGSQQSVTFAQPSSTAVTLNTVVGPDPSRIAGKITANGQIIIENQSGVVFYKGSQVDAAGLIVSAPAVTVPNFMAGKLVFDQAARPNASVVNQGHITIKDAGLAALVAPHVVNSGTITAKLGTVSLAGATVATVDLYGDGLVSIGVQGAVTRVPADADGTPVRALVTNTGVIQARGGTVQLSAAAVDGLVTNLVTAGGRISARSAAARTGSVVIDGVGGSVTIEGTLAAAGKAPGTTGGTVQVNATNGVTLAAGSKINVSGSAGGGTVAIGTTLARAKGGPSVIGQPTAKTVAIAAGATITANATATGNGGGVTVLSARNTAMAGTITAKGGARAGDGGFVEVSGQGGYALTGVVDVSAPHGKLGTILLDPANLEIINAASGDQDTNLTGGTIVAGGADTANDQVSNAEIDSLSGNIVLQATNTLKLAANTPITLQNNASLTLETLTGAITTGSGSRITASGTGAVTMLAGTIGSGATIALGSDLITDPASGAITLKADAGIGLGAVTLRTGLLDLSTLSSGGVTQSGAGVINAGTLQSSAGVHGTVTLSGTNTIGTIGTFEVTDGSFTMVDGASLIVAGPLITDTDITLQSPTITASGTLGAGGTLTLTAGSGGITDGGTGTITAGSLSGSTAGGVVLDDGFHSIGTIAGFSAASGFSLTTTGGLSVSGTVDAGIGNLSLNAAGGDIDLGGAGGISGYLNAGSVAGSQSVTLTASGGITEYNNSQITTGTLAGSAGGNVGLTHYNDIGSVGPFTSTGMFTLNDPNNTLILQGLTATTATIVAGSIDFAGSVNAGNGLDLTASTGAIIESSGSLTTGILSGSATGSVSLNSSGNTIAAINGFTASGDFNLANQGGLQISNSLHGNNITVSSGTIRVAAPILSPGAIQLVADGNIVVASTVSAGVKLGLAVRNHGSLILGDGVANAGTLVAGSGHTISVNTDTLVAGAGAFGGIVDAGAGVFEIAPQTPGFALSFGSGASGGTLGVPSGLAISAGTLRLGEALGAITAASIDIASGLSLGLAATLDLRTTGGVTQSAGTITAGSLTGSAAGDVSLTLPNSIASVGSFTVGAGDFSLTDTGNLGIAGPLTAANISLSSPTITATGSLGATGILTLTAGSGGIALNTGEILSGATVDLSASGGGVTQAASGVITATMLQSTSGVTGTVNLAGSANAIAGVGSFAVTSGDFGLFDAGALNMAGRVSAANIALDASTISIGGTLNATTSVALGAGAGGISETGSINAGTLTSIGTIIGGATLTGSNAIAALGTVFVSGGDFSLTDSGSLSVAGLVSGPNVVLSAGTIDIAGRLNAVTSVSLTAASGALTESTGNIITPILTGSAGTSASLNGGNTIATLGSFSANGGVSLSDSRDLSVIGPVSSAAGTVVINDGTAALTLPGAISAQAATLTAGSITIAGTLIAAGTASLGALSGGVQETGTIIAGTLVSGATRFGTVNLAGTANAIAGIGSFAVAGGDFLLTDTGLVSVAGPLTAQNISINAGSISVPGSIGAAGSLAALTGTAGIDVSGTINANAGTIGLNTGLAGAITLSGSLGALALIDLIAGGGITQTAGSLVAGTIDITAPGGVSAANGHILSTGGTIAFATPNGLVNAGETITAADISFSGNVTQASASFVIASQDISVAGLLTEGGGKMTAGRNIFLGGLDQTGGGIFAGATLSIGTGSGTAGWAGSTASGGSFSQTGGTLASAGAVNIFDLGQFSQTGGTIVAGGTLGITANTAAIPGAGITIAGTIAAGGGTSGFMLLASAGDAVLETSGLLGGPALTVNGDIIPGNALQAPAGTVRIAAGTGTQGFGQYSGANPINVTGAIPAVLVGGTIDIERPIGAATLGLYAQSLIGQGQSGSITATTLTGSAGVPSNGAWAAGLTSLQWTSAGSLGWATGSVGRVALNGTNPAGTAINTIGTLADFAATGDFLLADAAAMTVAPGANVVSSAGNLYIQNGSATGITFGAGSTIDVQATGGTLSLRTDALTNLGTAGATGAVVASGGTVEIAPNTYGSLISLGTTGGLSLLTADGIFADRLRIGAVTLPGGSAPILTAGSIGIGGTGFVSGLHVLELDALNDVGQSAPLSAIVLTGTAGSFSLGNAGNAIGTIGLAGAGSIGSVNTTDAIGGGVTIDDSINLTIAGNINAEPAGATISVAANTLTINGGVVSANGNVALSAVGGTIVIASSGNVLPVIEAGKTAALSAASLIQSDGVINAGTVSIGATGSATLGNGLIVSVNGSIGITSPSVTVQANETIAAVNGHSDVSFSGAVTQLANSYIGANGSITARGVFTERGGTMLAAGDVTLSGGLSQTGGVVAGSGNLTIGSAVSGTAGWAGSTGAGANLDQSGGTLAAGGNTNIFTGGTFTQSAGLIASGGTLGVTATGNIDVGGTISAFGTTAAANSGFMLLSATGNATVESGGLLAGGALTVNGNIIPGNALQAPAGVVLIAAGTVGSTAGLTGAGNVTGYGTVGGYLLIPLTAPSVTTLPLPAKPSVVAITAPTFGTNGGTIAAVLIGRTVDIERPISASTQGLYAKSLIEQGTAGVITADTLTGSAGVLANGSLVAGLISLKWTNAASLGWNTGAVDTVGSVTLNAANQVGTLADFAVIGNFALTDQPSLLQTGSLQAGTALNTAYSGTATPDSVAITVTQGDLTVDGTIADGIGDGAGRPGGNTSLTALIGAITTTGTIAAVPGAGGGLLTINAGTSLSQTGGVLNAGAVTIAAPGGVTLTGGLLVATQGTIGVTAPLTTVNAGESIAALNTGTDAWFSGNVTQNASSYIGANRDITAGGVFTENGGTMLAVGGINLGAVSQSGGLIAASQAIHIGGTGIAGRAGSTGGSGGGFSQAAGTLAAGGAINIFAGGSLSQSAGALILAGGTLGVTAGSGIDIAGTVSAAGPATGFMLLTNAGNATLETSGLLAGPALTVTGDLIPGNVLQAPGGTVLVAGITGTQGFGLAGGIRSFGTVTGYTMAPPAIPLVTHITAPTITAANATGTISAALIGGAIDVERKVAAAELGVYAQSAIFEGNAGSIVATTLLGSSGVLMAATLAPGLSGLGWSKAGLDWNKGTADIVGTVTLNGSNLIGNLGTFSAPGGFSLTDIERLSVTGSVSSNNGTVAINTGTFALGLPGTISASAATLSAGTITIGGTLSVTNTADLISSGSIAASGMTNAGTLTGSAGTTASFVGNTNTIATLASFSAPDGFTLNDTAALSVSGPVKSIAGAVSINDGTATLSLPGTIAGLSAALSAGSIDIAGTLSVTNTASLAASGGITEAGVLNAATLTGSAGTSADFIGGNMVGTLAAFSALNQIKLTDHENLFVTGPLTAQNIQVDDSGYMLTLSGGMITTGGDARPYGPLVSLAPYLPSAGQPGAYLIAANVVQTGTTTINGQAGSEVLQISLSGGAGTATFATLSADTTWLILSLNAGSATGPVMNLKALDVVYASSGGSAVFGGTIDGITGVLAAANTFISPVQNSNYRIDGCPIQSVNCVIIPRNTVPQQKQIDTLDFLLSYQSPDDPDLIQILPNVSNRDY